MNATVHQRKWLRFYRNRSGHENDIEQLKNGVNVLTPSSDTLFSIGRMEFKRFLNTFIRIPCLIVKTGRRIYYRLVGCNDKLKHAIGFS